MSSRRTGTLLLALLLLAAPAQAFQNEPDGFGGMIWGAPLSASPAGWQWLWLRRAARTGRDEVTLSRTGENLALGRARLRQVRYIFYKGRLSAVILSADAKEIDAFRAAMLARFGTAARQSVPADGALWPGDSLWVGDRTTIDMWCRHEIDQCGADLRSVALAAVKRRDAAAGNAGPAP